MFTFIETKLFTRLADEHLADDDLEYELRDRTADRFRCRVYANGERLAQCSIWLGSMSSHGDSEHIFFSQSQTHESDLLGRE